MALRFRRSVKLMPGVRLNFNKNSMGVSVGVRGAHMSVNTKGQVYSSVGVPGTGLYNIERSSLKASRGRTSPSGTSSAGVITADNYNEAIAKPGLFANKEERDFYSFIRESFDYPGALKSEQVAEKAETLIATHPNLELLVKALAAMSMLGDEKSEVKGQEWLKSSWDQRNTLSEHPLYVKYFPMIHPTVKLAQGISMPTTYGISAMGYIYSEQLQSVGKFAEALEIVNQLSASDYRDIAIADLQVALGSFDEIITSTENVVNEDDLSAVLLIFRGIALREKGFYEAAREALKSAHASKKRSEDVLNFALFERAACYEKEKKYSAALKDLEKIMATDSTYAGLTERIAALREKSTKQA